jgi:hypothetical protein
MKRIINGKTYNTETATKICDWSNWDIDPSSCSFEYGEIIYQTRYGAYFLYKYAFPNDDKSEETITPFSPQEAQEWMENVTYVDLTKHIEEHFGEMPEAGISESRITLRMPDSLKSKIEVFAKKNQQSLNAWIVKTIEKSIAYERG